MTAPRPDRADPHRSVSSVRLDAGSGAVAHRTPHPLGADDITRLRARPVIDVAHCVTLSGLSRSTVNRAIATGELRSRKVGSRRLVEPRDLEAWLGVGQPAAD